MVPADRKLYALRDVTATVESIPLITASIMSKKLAEGLDALVLDVKHGSGAFMKTLDDAHALARSLVDTGKQMDVPTVALVTDMNQPLGRMAGNAVEVDESVAALSGSGPPDLMHITLALGAELLMTTGSSPDLATATTRLQATIDDGSASKNSVRWFSLRAATSTHRGLWLSGMRWWRTRQASFTPSTRKRWGGQSSTSVAGGGSKAIRSTYR